MTLFTVIIIFGVVISCFLLAILNQLHNLRRWLSTIHSDLDELKMAVEHMTDLEDKRAQVEHLDDQLEFQKRRRLEP